MSENNPIFKPIFADSWDKLPPVMHKHYANHPYSCDLVTVEGKLDVMCKWFVKPFFWLLGIVPACNEKQVPVTVYFKSEPDSRAFCFARIFNFSNRKPFHFNSKMLQVRDNEVMEILRYGICWLFYYSYEGEKVMMRHKEYAWRIAGRSIALPITWLIGKSEASEWAIDEQTFAMCVTITHPLLGKLYAYEGSFKVIKEL